MDATDDPELGALPAVVAVVPTLGPTDHLAATLESLVSQDYSNLTVVVVDAGDDPNLATAVAEVSPAALIINAPGAASFGRACAEIAGSVQGATFLLFVHDDVVLEPDATTALVAEAFRANAGIVGAKVVDHDGVLLSVGANIDKFGALAPVAEPGELDQGQHDAVAEVFTVSSVAMLVRADLFEDLGGFVDDLGGPTEDLDLCWRARLAGARTIVMPAARARHAQISELADPSEEVRRLATRHEARTLLACYSAWHLLRVVPQAVVFSLFDLIGSLLGGRIRRAGDIVSAWGWNLAHLPATLRHRRRAQRARRVSDREIRALQVRGSARVTAALRRLRATGGAAIPAAIATARGLPTTWQGAAGPAGAVLAAALMVLYVLGARELITSGVPVIRDFVPLPGFGPVLREWWWGWRSSGLGSEGAAPGLFPLIGLGGVVTFGSAGLARTLGILGFMPLGVLGAWRLLRGVASPRARVAAALAYVGVALPYDALAEGRVAPLVTYAVLPWIVGCLARVSAVEPMVGNRREVAVVGAWVALGAAIAPVVALVVAGVTVVMAAALWLGRHRGGARRVLTSGGAGMLVAAVVLFPTTLDVLTRPDRWAYLIGSRGPLTPRPDLGDILTLSTGSTMGGWLWLAVPAISGVVLFIARGWRLRWAGVAWALTLGGWGVAVVVSSRWPDSVSPTFGVLVAPAAVGIAWAVGLGVESVGTDVLGGRFGWRQALVGLAAIGVVLGAIPVLLATPGGRFGLPESGDVAGALTTLATSGAPNERVVWIGPPDLLPAHATGTLSVSGAPVGLATTDGVWPGPTHLQPAAATRADRELLAVFDAALAGGAGRLGAAMAPFGVAYVVVMRSPTVSAETSVPPGIRTVSTMLADQLDLQEIDLAPGVDLYRSLAGVPIRSVGTEAVLGNGAPPTRFTGRLPAEGELRVAMPQPDAWRLRVGGRTVDAIESSSDWAQRYPTAAGGLAQLERRRSVSHQALVIIQLALVAGLLAATRRRSKEAT
jgi:GT2 family glycosyltransferase